MQRRVLAVSSGGGHWVELMRVAPAFADADMTFVTVNREYRKEVPQHRFYKINDATRWNKFALLALALRLLWIIWKEKPHVIVTTGAAPGYFALKIGKALGARTIWIDSIANVEELSMSGRLAGECADLWLTQWPHLAAVRSHAGEDDARQPQFAGAVL